MLNLMSYVGMNLQAEVCVWTLMGIVRTIFDATLFKVNSNLKEVWLMEMPEELMMPIQRIIRMVISGVMLVQCFTVHAYLAAYIVLLYPVLLEDKPTLVLPWLLLAAIRKLLCELTSLALGLGICVLLGPSRPPCVKFVVTKLISIMGSLYMWMLVLNYYHSLKIVAAFKTIPAALASSSIEDYGLELAVRRRKTKSLFNEQMLRQKLLTNYYKTAPFNPRAISSVNLKTESVSSLQEPINKNEIYQSTILNTNRDSSEMGNLYDLFGVDISIPRVSDRILEQFVLMLLRVSSCLKNEETDSFISLKDKRHTGVMTHLDLDCSTDIENDASVSVHNRNSATSSYLTDFPQIFQKKDTDSLLFQSNERTYDIKQVENSDDSNIIQTSFKAVTFTPHLNKEVTIEIEKSVSYKTVDNKSKTSKNETPDTNGYAISVNKNTDSSKASNNINQKNLNSKSSAHSSAKHKTKYQAKTEYNNSVKTVCCISSTDLLSATCSPVSHTTQTLENNKKITENKSQVAASTSKTSGNTHNKSPSNKKNTKNNKNCKEDNES